MNINILNNNMKLSFCYVLLFFGLLQISSCSSKKQDPTPPAFIFNASLNGGAMQALTRTSVVQASFGMSGAVDLYGVLPDGRTIIVRYGSDYNHMGTDTELTLLEVVTSSFVASDVNGYKASNPTGKATYDPKSKRAAGTFSATLFDSSTIIGNFSDVQVN